MKNIFNPIYNAIINIVAYSLLGALFYLDYNENGFFVAGVIISVFIFFLYTFHLKKYQPTTKTQHLVFLITTIFAMLLMLIYYGIAIKRSDYFLLILSLASLSPFYNFCGYVRFTQVNENTSLLKYILGIMLVPFTVFLIYNHYAGTNYKTIYMIIMVAAYYFVIFALIKIAVLVIKEKDFVRNFFKTSEARKHITLFLTIVMPITGLILNQYMYSFVSQYAKQLGYNGMSRTSGGIFGDFSHPIFYVLTLINGIALLIPIIKHNKLRLPIFFLRSMGFCFIAYMFLVFLPVLPVGVLTLFFIVGIYAFIPLLVAWWQGKMLLEDYKLLQDTYKKKWIITVFVSGFLTLPLILTSFFIYDKINFEKALVYADQQNIDASGKIDIDALERTLSSNYAYTHRTQIYRSSLRTYYSYGNIPIISGVYKQFMFGGEDLSWEYRSFLDALFLSGYYYDYDYDYASNMDILDYYNRNKSDVRLTKIDYSTSYDENIQAYRTWIDLELTNSYSYDNEYTTAFYVPDGVYVSDYYLYVGNEKKMGLLTDRRAALAIYKKIVLSKLDPGILHYIDDNLLELRVFPFYPTEERKTGFELIHKNEFELEIDYFRVKVEVDEKFSELKLPNAVLLSYDEIQKLPPLNKGLSYNFILDCSEDSNAKELSKIISDYCRINEIDDGNLYLTNYRFDKFPLKDINKVKIKTEGGFNLNIAVKDIIKNANNDSIPIIIFVSEKEGNQIIKPKQINNYASPESEHYYRLGANLRLTPYSLFTNYEFEDRDEPIIKNAKSYEGYAVINDGDDKLLILNDTTPEPTNNQYLDAISLAVESRINTKNGMKSPVSYIKKSFLSHVLTPATAFIVVETKEQEEALLKLQEEILNESEGQDSNNLFEPHVFFMAILFSLYIFFKKIAVITDRFKNKGDTR